MRSVRLAAIAMFFVLLAACGNDKTPGGRKTVDEGIAEASCGPVLEFTKVELEPNDGEMGVERRPDIHGPIQDAHPRLPP